MPTSSALLLVNPQNATCGPDHAERRPAFDRLCQARTLPPARQALAFCLTADGRDCSLDY